MTVTSYPTHQIKRGDHRVTGLPIHIRLHLPRSAGDQFRHEIVLPVVVDIYVPQVRSERLYGHSLLTYGLPCA